MSWLGDIVDDVVGWVGDVVHNVVHTLSKWLSNAVHWLGRVISEYWPEIVGVIAIVVIIFAPYLAPVFAAIAEGLSAVGTAITTAYAALSGYVAATSFYVSQFLTAIHFSAIMAVNNIALLVSPDWRNFMAGLYGRIAQVSASLGLDAQYMSLALRNVRALVLDASTTIGQSYDLAEVSWVNSLTTFFQTTSKTFSKYKNNAAAFFQDIDDYFVKPAMDVKSKSQQIIISTIDNTVKLVDSTVKNVVKVKDDLQRTINQAPPIIRKMIKEDLDEALKPLNAWVTDIYDPTVKALSGLIDNLKVKQDETKANMSDVVDQLTRPGDLLKGADKLTPERQQDQLNKISEVATRNWRLNASAMTGVITPVREHLQGIADVLKLPVASNPWYVPELPPGKPFNQTEMELRKTWYVGDY